MSLQLHVFLFQHVRGAKHQYFSPNEIPNYQPTKAYHPTQTHERRNRHAGGQKTNFFKSIREEANLTYLLNQNMSASSSFYKNYFYNQIMANANICNKTNLSRHCQRTPGGRKMSPPSFHMNPLEAMSRDHPFDMCFYDYFFRTQELIHNQNYNRYSNNFGPFANYSNGIGGGGMMSAYPGMPQLFDENLVYPHSLSSPDMVKHLTAGSIGGGSTSASIDYSSDQQSWPSYSSVNSPNSSFSPYLNHFQAQQPYFAVNSYGSPEPYSHHTVHSAQFGSSLSNNSLPLNNSNNNIQLNPANDGSGQLSSQPNQPALTNQSMDASKLDEMSPTSSQYRLVSKSFSGQLVQITPAPALNNGVSMLVMNSEGINATVTNNAAANNPQFVTNGNQSRLLIESPKSGFMDHRPASGEQSSRVYYQQQQMPQTTYHYSPSQLQVHQQQQPMQYHQGYMNQQHGGGVFPNGFVNKPAAAYQDDSPTKLIRNSVVPNAQSAFTSYFHHTVY